MGPTVGQAQEVHAVGKRLSEGLHTELDSVGIRIGQLQKAAFTCERSHGPIDIERLKAGLDQANRLDAADCKPPSTDRQPTAAAFVLTDHAHRAGMLRRADALQRLPTGRLQGRAGVRVFWCD